MMKWRAFGAGLAATLILGIAVAQVSSVGGLPARPRFQALTVTGASNNATVSLTNATPGKGTMSFVSAGTTRGLIGVTGGLEGDTSTDFGLFSETAGGIRFYTNGSVTEVLTLNSAGSAVFAGAVQVQGAPILKYAAGTFTGGGACALDGAVTAYGITSCNRGSAGNYTVNYTAAGFAARPVCVAVDVAGGRVVDAISSSSTSMSVHSVDVAGAVLDTNFSIYCVGT